MEAAVLHVGTGSGGSRAVRFCRIGPVLLVLAAWIWTGAAAAAPAVSFLPTSVDFGSQGVGTGSGLRTIQLSSSGDALLAIYSVNVSGANASDFMITADTGGLGFAPGARRLITLQFVPTALGPRSAFLTVSSSAPGSPQVLALTGTGVETGGAGGGQTQAGKGGLPGSTVQGGGGVQVGGVSGGGSVSGSRLSLSPAGLEFGTLAAGTSATGRFAVTNTSAASVEIQNINVVGDREFGLFVSSGGSVLQPGESRTVVVRFSPTTAGDYNALLIVFFDGGNRSISARIHGAATGGIGNGVTTLIPGVLEFGTQRVGARMVRVFRLINTGTGTLRITRIAVTGALPGEFSVLLNCPSPRVLPGESCTGSVTFSPGAFGDRTAVLTVFSDSLAGPASLTLRGTGTF